jgi:hypothetical protein
MFYPNYTDVTMLKELLIKQNELLFSLYKGEISATEYAIGVSTNLNNYYNAINVKDVCYESIPQSN